MTRLSRAEKFRRTLADIAKRNESLGRQGLVWSESCRCPGGYDVRSLYGFVLVGVTADALGDPTTMQNPCPEACGYLQASRNLLRDARTVNYRKLRRFFGSKLEVAGKADRVVIGAATIDARLAHTVLRNLDAKRVRVGVTDDMGSSTLHLADEAGSWVAQIRGMRTGHEWPAPSRQAGLDELAGRRRSRR